MSKFINASFGGSPCQAEIDSQNILRKAGIRTQGRCGWFGPNGDARTGLFIPLPDKFLNNFQDMKADTKYDLQINGVHFTVVKRNNNVRGVMNETLLRVTFGLPLQIVVGD